MKHLDQEPEYERIHSESWMRGRTSPPRSPECVCACVCVCVHIFRHPCVEVKSVGAPMRAGLPFERQLH